VKLISVSVIFCVLSACIVEKKAIATEYDFDHKVQFKQQKVSQNTYYLEVIAKRKTSFQQLSAFLMRQSYKLCDSYGFKLEILNGVEKFDDRQVSASYIQPNLTANLECPKT